MRVYSIIYWKIINYSWFKNILPERKISYRTTEHTLLVCGPELKLLSLYLRLVQPEVKIFVLFYLMFPMKFTLATRILHYLKHVIALQFSFKNSSWRLPNWSEDTTCLSNWLKQLNNFKCYCQSLATKSVLQFCYGRLQVVRFEKWS